MPERTAREGETSELRRESSSLSGQGVAQVQMLTADNLKGIASVEVRLKAPPLQRHHHQQQPRPVLPLTNNFEYYIASV